MDAVHRNVNEKCAIFLQNTHFWWVLWKIYIKCVLLGRYRVLPLLSKIRPANSASRILFSVIKYIYTFMNKFYQTILAGKSFDKRSISDRFTYLDKHRSKVLSHLGTLTFRQSDILAFKALGYSSHLRHLGTQSTLALKELKHSRHWDTQRALEYSGTQGTSSLEALYLADSRVLRSLSF